MPHESNTGAEPGARQGWARVQSRSPEPLRSKVRHSGLFMVGFMLLPQAL